jgi:hypothetical protein
MTAFNNYKSILISTLIDTFNRFSENPYYYFYEEDIRVDIVPKLIQQINPINVKHFDKNIQTIPIKCEYPILSSKQKHDIVFILPNDLNNIYNLDIPIAMELKLGSKSYDRCSEFKEDIKKLKYYKSMKDDYLGIAIYYYQDDIDHKYFREWFSDIVEQFDDLKIEDITFNYSKVNSFIITPSNTVLSAVRYK